MKKDEESWITVNLPKKIMECTALCQTAHRHGMSHHQVFATVTSVIPYSSGNFENFVLSPSTSRRKRMSARENLSTEIKRQASKKNRFLCDSLGWKDSGRLP